MKNTLLALFLCSCLLSHAGNAISPFQQNNKKDAKFLVGMKGGVNFTQPLVIASYNVFSSLDDASANAGNKNYKNLFRNFGYQYAFTVLYILSPNFDIRLEPTFTTYQFKYNTSYTWIASGSNQQTLLEYAHKQSLKYIEIPVTLRYLIGSGQLKPFVQVGAFYGQLLSALKTSTRTETRTSALGTLPSESDSQTGDASGLYTKFRYGLNGGVGVDYDLGAVRLTLDVNINFGINRITNQAARYTAQQFSGGLYDVQDDVRLLVPSVNVGVLFPLRKPARAAMKCPK